MNLAEPMTLLTDYVLCLQSFFYSILVFRSQHSRRHPGVQLWIWAFVFIGIGSFVGGTYHGFSHVMSDEAILWLRRITAYSMGVTSGLVVWGTSHILAMSEKQRLALHAFLVLKFLVFALFVTREPRFLWVIIDYAPAVIAIAVFETLQPREEEHCSSLLNPRYPFALALVVAVIGALVQQSGLSLHPHFNHNDLYHVIQMLGLHYFYQGAISLPERQPWVAKREEAASSDN